MQFVAVFIFAIRKVYLLFMRMQRVELMFMNSYVIDKLP